MTWKKPAVCIGILAVLGFLSACRSSEVTVDMDALTSATPGVAEAVLTDSHSGWRQINCTASACHDTIHTSGFSPGECTSCHGANGAPERPAAGCPDTDCSACHDKHPGEGFDQFNDCRGCHRYDVSGFDGDDPATCTHAETYDVVVIGAGGGGLAAAATLARGGKNVLVLEQHHRVGGQMTNFRRGDYRFEVSLHGFDGLGVASLAGLGIGELVEPVSAPVMYRAVFPDFTLDVPADVEEYRALMKETFPDEARGIDEMFDDMTNMLGTMGSYMDKTVSEALGQYVEDERIVTVMTQLAAFLGVEPDRLSGVLFLGMWTGYHLMGYHYFIGGSQSVADALALLTEENGGTIKLNTRATRIMVENGVATRVLTAEGGCYHTDWVVSNANAPDTFLEMIGEEHLSSGFVEGLDSKTLGLSVLVVYLGVDSDFSEYFPDTYEIFLNEGYDTNEHFQGIAECDPEKVMFGLANFTMIDPTTAPAGKNVITITSQLGYGCGDTWSLGGSYESYQEYKKEVAEVLVRRADKLLPGLADHIEVMEVATPRTVLGYTLNPGGSIFGWDMGEGETFMGPMSFQNLGTEIPNLYIAGAWAFGGGQSVVIMSGAAVGHEILNK